MAQLVRSLRQFRAPLCGRSRTIDWTDSFASLTHRWTVGFAVAKYGENKRLQRRRRRELAEMLGVRAAAAGQR